MKSLSSFSLLSFLVSLDYVRHDKWGLVVIVVVDPKDLPSENPLRVSVHPSPLSQRAVRLVGMLAVELIGSFVRSFVCWYAHGLVRNERRNGARNN